MDEIDRIKGESMLPTDERLTVLVTPVLMKALDKVARGNHTTVSYIVRESLRVGIPLKFEGFQEVYDELLLEETKRIKGAK